MKTSNPVHGIFKRRLPLSEGLRQIRVSGFRGAGVSVLGGVVVWIDWDGIKSGGF